MQRPGPARVAEPGCAAGQGAVPDALGNLTALSQLVLRGNALTGPLPGWVAGLPALRAAWLGDNNFSGPVPPAWCSGGGAFNISLQARSPVQIRSLHMRCDGPVPAALCRVPRRLGVASVHLCAGACHHKPCSTMDTPAHGDGVGLHVCYAS